MLTLREEMIAKGLLKPQKMFHDRAVELGRRYETASARLVEYDAKRKATQEADLTNVVKPKPTHQPSQWADNQDGNRAEFVNVAHTIQSTGIRRDGKALGLPLTKREQRLLNRLAQTNLSPEERQKAQRAFDHSRHSQESLKKREAERAAQAAKKKNRPKHAKLWISLPSKGSSMFGGVKYSYVSIWQGGLPGLGKRK